MEMLMGNWVPDEQLDFSIQMDASQTSNLRSDVIEVDGSELAVSAASDQCGVRKRRISRLARSLVVATPTRWIVAVK